MAPEFPGVDFRRAYRGRTVLVLGGAGFVGRWVARALMEAGAVLSLVVRERPSAVKVFGRYGVRGEIIARDLRRPGELLPLVRHVRPSITFNLVGYGIDRSERDEREAFVLNADLVSALAGAVARSRDPSWPGHDLVHVGSALEYGTIGGDLREDSLPKPTTVYGRSKLSGTENLLRRCADGALGGVVARLFMVYGPGEQEGRLLPTLQRAAVGEGPVELTEGSQRRDFTYVGDVAEGLLRIGAVKPSSDSIVNLATGGLTTVREFVETAARVLRISRSRLKFGALPTRPEEMYHEAVNIDRLSRLAGWSASTSAEEGIARTVRFSANM